MTPTMHVIHVIPSIHERASGPTYSVTRLCDSLLANGETVSLAALNCAPLDHELPSYARLFSMGFGPRRLGRSPALHRWLTRECAEGTPCLLHNHGMWQMNAIYPAWTAAKSNVPLVWSPRGTLSEWALAQKAHRKRAFWQLFQRHALQRTTCFHATAESEYQDLRRLGFKQPIAIIPNGIDIPSAASERHATRTRTLLFLSRLHPGKGVQDLLKAWSAIESSFPDWRLRIVGDDGGHRGTYGFRDRLVSLAQSLRLTSVAFSGPLYGDSKASAFREASLFVLPTFSENFGVVIAEALSHGTPVITTTGAPWAGLHQHDAGWWIDIGVEPLRACLQEAMTLSPSELAAKGARGRQWMKRDFSWHTIGQRMLETYRWIRHDSLETPSWARLD
jgi:glycosyltransferase involved in cell wall biosynthesis